MTRTSLAHHPHTHLGNGVLCGVAAAHKLDLGDLELHGLLHTLGGLLQDALHHHAGARGCELLVGSGKER